MQAVVELSHAHEHVTMLGGDSARIGAADWGRGGVPAWDVVVTR